MGENIDMIITKSTSRFAGNSLDCLKYIRELKDKNISVFFEKENINTMDSKGEVLFTIKAERSGEERRTGRTKTADQRDAGVFGTAVHRGHGV